MRHAACATLHVRRFVASSAAWHLPRRAAPRLLAQTVAPRRSFALSSQGVEGAAPRGLLRREVAELADLRKPHMWYSAARKRKRRVVLHVGPTNSGKTFQALQALQAAQSGLYCGPLRLLAWEIHERLNDGGVACDLITGQEKEVVSGSRHISSTVEMADVTKPVDVAVLDEVQMIGDEQRGWAWTRALLGVPADVIHACGDESAVEIVEKLCRETGDELEVHRYERLSPLSASAKPVKSISRIREGDCVVVFGRKMLFDAKRAIESTRGLRVGVIYGSLPPATRKEQARKFNNGETDVLVATDAVGMGLNLSIRRIVFTALSKFDGKEHRALTVSEMKQIGGRAGRYGSQYPKGTVAVMDRNPPRMVARALAQKTPTVRAAGLFPTSEQLELFARIVERITASMEADAAQRGGRHTSKQRNKRGNSKKKGRGSTPDAAAGRRPVHFSQLLKLFVESAKLDPELYFIADCEEMIEIAQALDPLELDLETRFTFCLAPINGSEALSALYHFARQFVRHGRVELALDVPDRVARTQAQLKRLEIFDLYVWLARRFPQEFDDLPHAQDGLLASQALIEESLQLMADKWSRFRKPARADAPNESHEATSSTPPPPPTDTDAHDLQHFLTAQLHNIAEPKGSPEYLQKVRELLDAELPPVARTNRRR